jgi:hypothetical protein
MRRDTKTLSEMRRRASNAVFRSHPQRSPIERDLTKSRLADSITIDSDRALRRLFSRAALPIQWYSFGSVATHRLRLKMFRHG